METELTTPIHFLVDYENVHYAGLRGVDFLNEYDKLTIFYSDKCPNIIKRDLDTIKSSGCPLDTCRLLHHGKNALDFYIAVECGVLGFRGENQISIISKDKGFAKVGEDKLTIVIVTKDRGFDGIIDYCKMRKSNCTIITAPTIEQGIMNIKGTDTRKELAIDKTSQVHFSKVNNVPKKEKQQNGSADIIKAAGLVGMVDTKTLEDVISAKYDNGRGLYFAFIREFGKVRGGVLYETMKKLEAKG